VRHGELEPQTLERARRGDARAFRALYEHHVDAIYAFLFRMLRGEAEAQDALQETFLRVARALPGFRPDGAARLSTWIFTIARRVALTSIEKARLDAGRAPDPGPAGAAPSAELRLALVGAIAALPVPQRAVFVLYECCALGYEEIAAVEGLDVGTVKSRLHRARATLQAALRDEPRPRSAKDAEMDAAKDAENDAEKDIDMDPEQDECPREARSRR
jgi:RNA polymerase sigma-70 factor (ECF subfamily)